MVFLVFVTVYSTDHLAVFGHSRSLIFLSTLRAMTVFLGRFPMVSHRAAMRHNHQTTWITPIPLRSRLATMRNPTRFCIPLSGLTQHSMHVRPGTVLHWPRSSVTCVTLTC